MVCPGYWVLGIGYVWCQPSWASYRMYDPKMVRFGTWCPLPRLFAHAGGRYRSENSVRGCCCLLMFSSLLRDASCFFLVLKQEIHRGDGVWTSKTSTASLRLLRPIPAHRVCEGRWWRHSQCSVRQSTGEFVLIHVQLQFRGILSLSQRDIVSVSDLICVSTRIMTTRDSTKTVKDGKKEKKDRKPVPLFQANCVKEILRRHGRTNVHLA